MIPEKPTSCPDCAEGLSRRDFVKTVAGVAAASAIAPLWAVPRAAAAAAPSPNLPAETAAKRLFESLKDDQKKVICFPFDHPLREKINANWAITKPTIEDFLNKDQQALVQEIFRNVTSPDGYERFLKQMDEDYGGFGAYHVAMFGEPGTGKFEFEMTGRHMTIRADGDSVANMAFGGPIIYGHGAGDSMKGLPGNVFYYQTLKANEVFEALDGKQRKRALVEKAPKEDAVPIQGCSGAFSGIGVADLSKDQKELVEKVIKVILAPYREEDIDEAMQVLKAGGGLDGLFMSFYESNDIGSDQVWDIWRLEGPTFVWHFRGAPHVHTYVNIAKTS